MALIAASVAPSVMDPSADGVAIDDQPEESEHGDADYSDKPDKKQRKEKKKAKRRGSLKREKSNQSLDSKNSQTSKSSKTSKATTKTGKKKGGSSSAKPPVTQNPLKHKGHSDVANELDRQRKLQATLRLKNGGAVADDESTKDVTQSTYPPNFRMIPPKQPVQPLPDPPNFRMIGQEGDAPMWRPVQSKSKMAWEAEQAKEREKEEKEAAEREKLGLPNAKRSRSAATTTTAAAKATVDKKGAYRGKSPTKRSVSSAAAIKADKKERRNKSPKRDRSPKRGRSPRHALGSERKEDHKPPRKLNKDDEKTEGSSSSNSHPKPSRTLSGGKEEKNQDDHPEPSQSPKAESQPLDTPLSVEELGDSAENSLSAEEAESSLNPPSQRDLMAAEESDERIQDKNAEAKISTQNVSPAHSAESVEERDSNASSNMDETERQMEVRPPSQRNLKQEEGSSSKQNLETDGDSHQLNPDSPQASNDNETEHSLSQQDLAEDKNTRQSPGTLVNPPSQRHLEEENTGSGETHAQRPDPPGTKGEPKKSRKHTKKRDKHKNKESSDHQPVSPASTKAEKPYLQLDIAAFEVMKDIAPPVTEEDDEMSHSEPPARRGIAKGVSKLFADKGGGGGNSKASDGPARGLRGKTNSHRGALAFFKNAGSSDRSLNLEDDDDEESITAPATPLPDTLDIRVMSSCSDLGGVSSNNDMELWGGTSLDLAFAQEMLRESTLPKKMFDEEDSASISLLPDEEPPPRRTFLRQSTASDRSLMSERSENVNLNHFNKSVPILAPASGDFFPDPTDKPTRKNLWKKIKKGFGGGRGKKDRQKAAATQIQAAWRSYKARTALQARQLAIIKIQSSFRGSTARKHIRKRNKRDKQVKAKDVMKSPKTSKKKKAHKSKGGSSTT